MSSLKSRPYFFVCDRSQFQHFELPIKYIHDAIAQHSMIKCRVMCDCLLYGFLYLG